MRLESLAILVAAAATVSAVPTKAVKRDFTNDENGNVKIFFSNDKIKIGTVKLDDIMDGLANRCGESGICDTGEMDFDGQLVAGGMDGEVDDITVKLHPSGSYPTDLRSNMIDALRAAIKAAADCEDVTNTPSCPNPAVFCPSEPFTVNECTVPRFWGIDYQDPDADDSAPPNIGANLELEIDSDGFCDTFTTIGEAVAGAVHGVAGGVFTLLSLACSDST